MSEFTLSRRVIGAALAVVLGGGALVGCSKPSAVDSKSRSGVPALATPGKPLDCSVEPRVKPERLEAPHFGSGALDTLSMYFDMPLSQLVADAAAYMVTCRTSLTGSIVSGGPVPLSVDGVPVNQQDCVAWTALYGDKHSADTDQPTNEFIAVCAPATPQTIGSTVA